MLHLRCPGCGKPHVDEGVWAEKPHGTHVCVDDAAGKGCGHRWDPVSWPTIGVLPVYNFVGRMFAEEKNGVFWHVNPSAFWVGLCAGKNASIVEVEVREDPEGRYHGWMGAGVAVPCFIWPTEVQRDICFDSVVDTERMGRGRRVRLTCTKIAEA